MSRERKDQAARAFFFFLRKNFDRKTYRIYDLRLLVNKKLSVDSVKHEWLAQNRMGQRQSQKVRSTEGKTLIALVREPKEEGLYHRQLVKSTLIQNTSALHHSDEVHSSFCKTRHSALEDQQQKSLKPKKKRPDKRQSTPSRTGEKQK